MTAPEAGTGDLQAAVLRSLAAVLRSRGFTAEIQQEQERVPWWEVACRGGGRSVPVRGLPRPGDGGRLWFRRTGDARWVCKAGHAHLRDALMHLKRALRQVPGRKAAPA